MNFSQALERIKAGELMFREGWNGKEQFISLQSPDENSKMTEPYIYMTIGYTPDQKRIPWLASQADLLMEDWEVVER